jgi:positive regulator of sigma E activity
MTEAGRVLEVTGNKITVVKDHGPCGETCFGCLGGGTCEAKPVLLAAENPLGLPLKPGQTVEIESGRFLSQALAALLPLPAGFAAGYFLVPRLFPAAGDPARAAGGVLCLIAAAAVCCLFRRRYPPRNRPRIAGFKKTNEPEGAVSTNLI